jgi:hypothetical protein
MLTLLRVGKSSSDTSKEVGGIVGKASSTFIKEENLNE